MSIWQRKKSVFKVTDVTFFSSRRQYVFCCTQVSAELNERNCKCEDSLHFCKIRINRQWGLKVSYPFKLTYNCNLSIGPTPALPCPSCKYFYLVERESWEGESGSSLLQLYFKAQPGGCSMEGASWTLVLLWTAKTLRLLWHPLSFLSLCSQQSGYDLHITFWRNWFSLFQQVHMTVNL